MYADRKTQEAYLRVRLPEESIQEVSLQKTRSERLAESDRRTRPSR